MNSQGIKALIISLIILTAGLLDLKYKGMFYRLLPKSLQKNIDKF